MNMYYGNVRTAIRKPAEESEQSRKWPHLLLTSLVLLISSLMYYATFHRQFGFIALIAISFLAFFSPYAGIVLLAASIDLPDPQNVALTSTQIVSLGFIVNLIVTGRFAKVEFPRKFLMPLGLFILLLSHTAISGMFNSDFGFAITVLKILPFVIMIIVLLQGKSIISKEMYLAAFVAGLAVAGSTYWFDFFGLDVTEAVQLWRGNFIRISGQDPNATAINLGAALIGGCFFLFSMRMVPKQTSSLTRTLLGGGFLTLVIVPPLVYTGSRAGLLGVFMTIAIMGLFVYLPRIRTASFTSVLSFLLVLIAILGVLFIVDQILGTGVVRVLDTLIYFPERGAKVSIWSQALSVASESPMFGVGNQAVFRARNILATDIHNTYLDFAVLAGFPALFLFFALTLTPLIMANARGSLDTLQKRALFIALSVYIYCSFTILFISVPGNKTFWLSWAMLLVMADDKRKQFGGFKQSKFQRKLQVRNV